MQNVDNLQNAYNVVADNAVGRKASAVVNNVTNSETPVCILKKTEKWHH